MRFRFFLFFVLGVYVLVQTVAAMFLHSSGLPWSMLAIFLLCVLSMPAYLNLSFAMNWSRPIWLMPIFFSYYFFSTVGVMTVGIVHGAHLLHRLSVHDGSGLPPVSPAFELKAVFVVWGFFLAFALLNRLMGPKVTEVPIAIPGLAPGLDGFRILQVSDVHVGLFESDRSLKRLRSAIERVPNDLLVFTGDMIDRRLDEVDRFLAFFGDLRGKKGVFGVMGNHEHWVDGPGVASKLAGAGWTLLENTSVSIPAGHGTLYLVGLTDPAAHERGDSGPSPEKAFAKVSYASGDAVVVLSHHPSLWKILTSRPAQLTLSGHTHGGQIGLPVRKWNLSSPFYDYDVGLFRRMTDHGPQYLYVNPGTGYFGVPIRLGVRSEITLFVLASCDPLSGKGG
jgi:predicted MPP superfamily phosphohydrolase